MCVGFAQLRVPEVQERADCGNVGSTRIRSLLPRFFFTIREGICRSSRYTSLTLLSRTRRGESSRVRPSHPSIALFDPFETCNLHQIRMIKVKAHDLVFSAHIDEISALSIVGPGIELEGPMGQSWILTLQLLKFRGRVLSLSPPQSDALSVKRLGTPEATPIPTPMA